MALALCSACEKQPINTEYQKNVANGNIIQLPSLPIIQNTISDMAPTIINENKKSIMRDICSYARGETTREQLSNSLRQLHIEIYNINQKSDPLYFLTSTDTSQSITACAAYIASSVLEPAEFNEFTTLSESDTGKPKKPNSSNYRIDEQKLKTYLSVQLAIANANTYIYTLIASKIQSRPGLSIDQYHEISKKLFLALAPKYLQIVREQHQSAANSNYTLIELSKDSIIFKTNSGFLYSYNDQGLNIVYQGIKWYGSNFLMGSPYFIKSDYFPNEIKILSQSARLAPAEKL